MSLFSLLTITILCWGIAQVLIKKGLTYLTPWQSYALDTLVAMVIWIPFGILTGINFNSLTLSGIMVFLFLGIAFAGYYYVIEKGPISIISPIFNTSPIITTILANLLIGESLTTIQFSAVVMTVIGVVIISIPEKSRPKKTFGWILPAIGLTVVWGLDGVLTKYLVETIGNGTYMFMLAMAQLTAVLGWKMIEKGKHRIPKIPPKFLLPTLLGVLLFNAATITWIFAMDESLASIVAPLSSTSAIITLILSMIFLKEKIRRIQILGIIIAITGAILINLNPSPQPQLINGNSSKEILLQQSKTDDQNNNSIQAPNTHAELVKIEKAKVAKVIDGDSILLANGRQVRYIGINSPEFSGRYSTPQCFAKEAYKYNHDLLEGKEVELVRDNSDKDKYGRLLRYVYIKGMFVNDLMLKNGLARIENIPPDTKYYPLFLESERQARENNLGLWKECAN